jgi:hypothetical protein
MFPFLVLRSIDARTVPDVVRDLEQRFGLKRVVFVGDRGMVTSQNLDDLRGSGHGYIVGRNANGTKR